MLGVNNIRMRRQSSNLNEEVILFLGECEILTLNATHQIALVSRTVLLKEEVLLTYQNPVSSVRESRLSRSKAPIALEKLTNHEHEFRVTAALRARLLLGPRDEGVEAYLKELRVDRPQQANNIVAVINQEENFMNGFVFREEPAALNFYESLNTAIATQMYIQKLPENLPFNARIVNVLAETLNGRCVVAPDDFAEGRQEEDEMRFVLDYLRGLQGEPGVNFRGQLSELQLRFRVVDETSRDYAVRFLEVFPERVERLVAVGCELSSNMVGQLLSAPSSLGERLTRLQELTLSRNFLNDDVFATLTKLLKTCRKLQTLNLNENAVSFEKEAIIVGFLCSIVHLRLNLQLASNAIHSARQITKYLLNAEGPLPLSQLDISFNPIAPEELNALTKTYLAKTKQEGFDFKLQLNQLEFQEPHSFEFLQEEYRSRKPNSMAIPMAITKHVMRKKGKEIGSTEEELNRAARVQELYRSYGIEVFRGNFFRLKQIRAELRAAGATEEAVEAEVLKYRPQKQLQEQMILRKVQACLNFETEPRDIVSQLNQTLRFCRRKGVSGTAFDLLACVKGKLEAALEREAEEGGLGRAYRQRLYSQRGRFKGFQVQFFREDYVFHINFPSLLRMSDKELLQELMSSQRAENLTTFMTLHYLLAEKLQRPHLFVLEACLSDPRLSSLKIARFERQNIVQIFHRGRVGKDFLPIPSGEERAGMLAAWGVESYRFSESFIESGVSSSAYVGMLSRGRVEAEEERQVLAFIEISKNFLKYLYYTPLQLSEQTLIYLSSITAHLASLQNPQENALKLLLAEELLIHMITFFDSTRYQPLKPGILTAVAEFVARRVALPEELLKRLAVFVLRAEGAAEEQLLLHRAAASEPWEGKADWKVGELPALGALVLSRGKLQVRVADAAHPELLVSFEVDELDTVLNLWGEVRRSVGRLNEITNISEGNIDYYWLCGGKEGQAGALRLLASFEHIGALLFEEGFDRFFLRRVLYRPEEHSLEYLARVKYEELLAIYEQGRESFLLAASLLLPAEATLEAVMLSIWADILLADELMLGELRRREDEESQARYAAERERVVGECMSRLYNRYVPLGFALDEAARNRVIFDTKSRQMAGVPKNFNEAIKATVLAFLRRTGVTAFTAVLPSAVHPYTLFINNHHIIFEDRSQPEPKLVRALFRSIIEFQLTADGDSPILKFEVAEGGGEELGLHRFSVQGDGLWIGQCFALISQVARNRLAYPPDLLFANEDEPVCLSNCPIRAQVPPLLTFPLLAVDKYFSFTLPRRQEEPAIAVVPPPAAPPKPPKAPANDSPPPLIQSSKIGSLLAPERAQQQVQSLGVIPEWDSSIEEIIKSAQDVGEDVITSRRSSNKSKEVPRRRSRNR